MAQEHYPLGKLHKLTAAHKSVVDALSQLFPASSSADEILPTLIYSLITSRPESVNVISDLKFIQRYRASTKIDGEAAYCLVNLEAAVAFLETVDLSSLRADELPQGPDKHSSRPSTPGLKSTPMELGIAPATGPTAATHLTAVNASKPLPSSVKSPRRLSHLIATQTGRIEAASDSIRSSVLDGADQAIDTINSTLESSFRFLFGRLKEHQAQAGQDINAEILPKTLEDARKLVSTPPLHSLGDDDESTASALDGLEGNSAVDDPSARSNTGDRMLELVGGRRPLRDHSVDSARSGGSGTSKRVSFLGGAKAHTSSPPNIASPSSTSLVNAAATTPPTTGGAIENMRNLGNTLNPLNQFAKIGFFGRTAGGAGTSGTATPTFHPAGVLAEKETILTPEPPAPKSDKEVRTLAAVDEVRKGRPPTKRFLECKDAKDLKLGEVEELLRDYQRLSAALGKVVSSSG